jgi:hypothetical protein
LFLYLSFPFHFSLLLSGYGPASANQPRWLWSNSKMLVILY